MPYIIGTAGHIDHGKTTLIKALTGQDTDRLKEEKERGISIDLGFAHFDLDDGSQAGIVDVPGHERFIRNMLAGAHGMDLVLFTVAADDGVMPQTEEHLDIVHLLGVRLAIFIITKTDLVPPVRVGEVEEEIQILTAGTVLESSPVIPFSAVTGHDLEGLKKEIMRMLAGSGKTPAPSYFRLPVDRVFALAGHGVIVTGTALSGEVRVGDRVRCLPGDQPFRVRSIQVHNQAVEASGWGRRVALNLSGPDRSSIERGHVICHEKITRTTDRFDALLELRPAAKKGLKNHQRVRVHAGTAERLGKVVLLGPKGKLEPKESAPCQVILSFPVLLMRGDRFIIRDETAQRTLGGGRVLHPWSRPHKKKENGLQERLAVFGGDEPALITQAFLDDTTDLVTPFPAIAEFLNVTEESARIWVEQAPGLMAFVAEGEKGYCTEAKWQRFRDGTVASLRDFHGSHPLAPGMDMEELREKLPFAIPPRLFRALVDELTAEQAVAREGNVLRLPEYKVQLKEEEKSLTDGILRFLRQNPLAPPDLKDLEKQMGIARAKLTEVVRLMERQGFLVRVATDLYFPRESVDRVKAVLYKYLSEHEEINAATFRDLLSSSRKFTIALLEHFDREGVTIRIGDARR
ncbi:MAG TPA: selenocysteine-specific translation elongation factor, partial [Candidatus Binatia bacterium]